MSPLATARSTCFAIACFTCAVDAEYRSRGGARTRCHRGTRRRAPASIS
jgi:hypothetical protein